MGRVGGMPVAHAVWRDSSLRLRLFAGVNMVRAGRVADTRRTLSVRRYRHSTTLLQSARSPPPLFSLSRGTLVAGGAAASAYVWFAHCLLAILCRSFVLRAHLGSLYNLLY